MKFPKWSGYLLIAFLAVVVFFMANKTVTPSCPGSYVWCPGVGCVSGPDKCFAGNRGGPSAVFSREGFVNKQCPDKTRTDGPCLMEF